MSNSNIAIAQGTPLWPVEVTAPVANTTAGVWEFRTVPNDPKSRFACQFVRVENFTGVIAYIKFEGTTSDPANTFDYNIQLPSGGGVSLEMGVQRLSIWLPTGATIQRVQPIVNTSGTAGSGSGTATYSIYGWAEGQVGRTTAPFVENS